MRRLPIICHIRWLYHSWQIARHYEFYAKLGYYEASDHDRLMLDAIWRGEA